MSRRTRTICAGSLATGLVAVAIALLPGLLQGYDNRPGRARDAQPSDRLIVHEWGTFTSFAGSDGVNLEFRPLVTHDLPSFIMRPHTQPGHLSPFAKPNYVARQRMETPVTYFYTDKPRVVNARVDFPRGMLTEWYPVVKRFEPGKQHENRPLGNAFLDWGAIRLTPQEQFAEIRVRGPKNQSVPAELPPVGKQGHYAHARQTDSAIVEAVDIGGGSHFEKFLFYRGVGNFELPIKLVALGNDRFTVHNSAAEATGGLLLVRIERGRVRFARTGSLGPQSTRKIELPSAESSVEALAAAMVDELTAAGLYEKEALAMVNTWRSSWFGENGTRLLYLLPGKQTDELLPLSIEPVPDECVRVLVGRLETLVPEDCARLVQALAGDAAGAPPSAEAVKAELEVLGRFAEPAIGFVIAQTHDPATRMRLEVVQANLRKGR